MLFFIHYKGKEHRIRVESRRNQLYVAFENEPESAIDLMYYGNDASFIQDNRVFHANVVANKTDFTVWRPQGNIQVAVESEYRRIVGLLRGQDLQQDNAVFAKMPGKIVKIHAKVGAEVSKGDPVMVMEAMKMENEIRAPKDGTIASVLVKEGQAVETGALLLELKAAE